jgi:hypothetical protein
LAVVAAGLGVLYWRFNPADTTNFFPPCPLRALTGYQCPGCGSQRAIYQLLHLNVTEAFILNPLLIISLPYVAGGFVFEKITMTSSMLMVRKALYGPVAIWVVFVVVIVFWVGRNLM